MIEPKRVNEKRYNYTNRNSQPVKRSSTTDVRKTDSSDDEVADACPQCLLALKWKLIKCEVCLGLAY